MKKLFIVLALAMVSVATYAQDEPVKKHSVATNSFWSNWFIEVGADWNAWYSNQEHFINGQDSYTINPFKKFRSNPGASVAIGKWFTPGIGLRTKVQGIWGKQIDFDANEVTDNTPGNGYKYWNAQEQVLFNVSNMLCGYNSKRVWNVIPFLGAGINRNMTDNNWAMSYSAGIKNTFRLNDHVLVNLELGYVTSEPDADGNEQYRHHNRWWRSHDNKLYGEVGLTFNLGKATWDKTPDVDAIKALYQSQIDALNAQLNDANAEIARLKNLLANQKPEVKVVKDLSTFPVTVFFNINKTDINSKKDLVNVENFAKLASELDAKVLVTGYADSATGNDKINQSLSEGRAEALANQLVEYGVNRDNITTEAKGGVAILSPIELDRRATAEIAK